MISLGTAESSLTKVASTVSTCGCGEASSGSASAPTPGTPLARAVTTYVQNVVGWLSPSSNDSHATARGCRGASASQAARAVVLPKPAGAETSASLLSAP